MGTVLAILKCGARFLETAGKQSYGKKAVPRLEEFRPPETHGRLASENGHQGNRSASFDMQCLRSGEKAEEHRSPQIILRGAHRGDK